MANYYILTGGAGFIGSNLLRALNERGLRNIIVVDNLERSDKFRNLIGCQFEDYLDKREFIERLVAGPYLEMFARESAPGWDAWGNETTKFDKAIA